MAIAFMSDGVAVASVRRSNGSKPAVTLAGFVPSAEAPTPEMLEKLGKELQANTFHCTSYLRSGQYQMVVIDALTVPQAEWKTAVKWKLKDIIDFPVDEATLDVIDMPVEANARNHSMFAVAARNEVIEARMGLFAKAKFDLDAIDIPEMAQRNISVLLEPEGRGVAVLSFSEDGGLLTVSFKGELYLSRRIDVNLQQLLEPDADRRSQSFDRITLELQRSLDHFDRQFSFINVSKLYLAPSEVQGLQEYLTSNLYTPVDTLKLDTILDLEAVPELADLATQQRFFLPIGAAMREKAVAA
ncbi:type IV pilus biogenesis protein PilM [Massilia sp. TS11]|uniref:type IV pilus biogenesis protein PilM n=1 Tax=Massilia sp. TS11 TaxID=2908003 RepID=UPI001EDB6A48|nr:pilus assembly protein PilM [Massilia sp. TS11]MCG2584555.1 pilus assembly protein PilM [Massilia sp. TS11]